MRSPPSVTFTDLIATDRTRYESIITSISATSSSHGAYIDTSWSGAVGAAFDGAVLSVRSFTGGVLILDSEL
jgi:hypothetical protein